MSEYYPEHEVPPLPIDWQRLDVALRRFQPRITEGIALATLYEREIDDGTARMIAHVIGRGVGRASVHARYGRTGEIDYDARLEESLALYYSDGLSPQIRELLDWLGSYLYAQQREAEKDKFPRTPRELLTPAGIKIGNEWFMVNVLTESNLEQFNQLAPRLAELGLPESPALQAYLTLPDTDAGAPDLAERFQAKYAGSYEDMEAALRALGSLRAWTDDLEAWTTMHGTDHDSVMHNLKALSYRLSREYEIVELKGQIHAFIR